MQLLVVYRILAVDKSVFQVLSFKFSIISTAKASKRLFVFESVASLLASIPAFIVAALALLTLVR